MSSATLCCSRGNRLLCCSYSPKLLTTKLFHRIHFSTTDLECCSIMFVFTNDLHLQQPPASNMAVCSQVGSVNTHSHQTLSPYVTASRTLGLPFSLSHSGYRGEGPPVQVSPLICPLFSSYTSSCL